MGYNPRKAAETVAYFIMKSGCHGIDVLTVTKLVYLADRESLKQYGYPIQDEERLSMSHGPVNSRTLDYLYGKCMASDDGGWSDILTVRENHHVALINRDISVDDLGELSLADIKILDQVWVQFGEMADSELRNWTQDAENIPEWQNPGRSSKPISLLAMLKAVSVKNPKPQLEYLEESQAIDDLFDSLKIFT